LTTNQTAELEDRIRQKAYELWEAEGRVCGYDQDHWARAVKLVHVAVIGFDEEWYLERYPDIARAVAKGIIPSGYHHYKLQGFKERRLPLRPE
jgi:hypothetical protein